MASDGIDDGLEVVEQEAFEPQPFVVVEVGAGEHRADVRVEVGDRRGERAELQEHGGHHLGQLGGVLGGDPVGAEPGEGGEAVGDGGEQLAGDLAGPTGGGEDLLDLPVDAHPEGGGRIAGGLALVVGDRRDPHLTRADEQVAVGLQVAQALLDDVDLQADAALSDVLRRPLGQQSAGEQAHDRHVLRRLAGGGVGVQPEPVELVRRVSGVHRD